MKKINNKIIYNILILCVVFLSIFDVYYFFIRPKVGPHYYFNRIFSKPSDPILELNIYEDLAEEYRRLNITYKDGFFDVFVGDSITKRFNINEFFQNNSILNRGIFSDTTLGLMRRMDDNINNLKINKLFIMIGYNDLKYRDDDEIVNNIIKIVSKTKAKNIYVQSILPIDYNRKIENERIDYINSKLKTDIMCKEYNYVYIDLNSLFKGPNGGIKSELTRDGTHPNYMGYSIWCSAIKYYL